MKYYTSLRARVDPKCLVTDTSYRFIHDSIVMLFSRRYCAERKNLFSLTQRKAKCIIHNELKNIQRSSNQQSSKIFANNLQRSLLTIFKDLCQQSSKTFANNLQRSLPTIFKDLCQQSSKTFEDC